MKKKMKVVLAMVLAIATMLGCASAAGVAPRWSYVTLIDGTLSISSGGTASVSAMGEAYTKGVDNVKLTVTLQQKKGSSWSNLTSWTVISNTRAATLTKQLWPVAHGYSYRVFVMLQAYDGTSLKETGSTSEEYGYFA